MIRKRFGRVVNIGSIAAEVRDLADRAKNKRLTGHEISGSTFTVACSTDMAPTIFVTGTRTIINGANSLPFNLSLTSGAAADDLPATLALATALTVVQDGTEQVVPLYARLAKVNFGALPAGVYANGSAVTVSVLY